MLQAKPSGKVRTKARSQRGAPTQAVAMGFEDSAMPYSTAESRLGGRLVTGFFDEQGSVVVDRVTDRFGMSRGQLAETVGLRPETLQRVSRALAARTQSRVTEMLEIIGRIAGWAGGERQAMAWYRAEPIPAFGGRTAEALVKEGKAAAVRDYLDHIALGGFA
jgi:hypothetical protein